MADVESAAHSANGHASADADVDAQAQVVASLRQQVADLFTQVGQLNGKLVSSYDRVSDLEDSLHARSESLKATADRVRALEAERSQHINDLSAGLLVEKSQVTAELTRLMDRATEEAAKRGQAESARVTIESELGELSTNLFEQANRMVKEANVRRDQAERRAGDAEDALRTAEEAIGGMQIQMQLIRSDRDELKNVVDKGKWVGRVPEHETKVVLPKFISSHLPYEEFLLFVAHLRSLRPQPVPAISSLLPLAFLARLVTEDSDPTLRLDVAPALNWLSRRAVASAVHAGSLDIAPVTTGSYLIETSNTGAGSPATIVCALCGKRVHGPEADTATTSQPPPVHPTVHRSGSSMSGWGGVFKQNGASASSGNGRSAASRQSSISSTPTTQQQNPIYQTQIFVFRVTANSTTSAYALCSSGWCLPRLRATCALWHYVRTGIVERIWEEEMPSTVRTRRLSSGSTNSTTSTIPSIPLRKHASAASIGFAGTIGNMVRTVSGSSDSNGSSTTTSRRQGSGVGSLFGMLGGGRNSAPANPAPPLPARTSSSAQPPLTSANRTPGMRSPTLGSATVARRRPSETQRSVSTSSIKAPSVDRAPEHSVQSNVDSKGPASVLSPIENGIDETGPPAEVMFDFDDPMRSPPIGGDMQKAQAASVPMTAPTSTPTLVEETDADKENPQSDVSPVAPAVDAPVLAKPVRPPPRNRPTSATVVPLPMSPPMTPEPTTPPAIEASKAAPNGHTPKNSIVALPRGTSPARATSPVLGGRAVSPALGRAGSPALGRPASPIANGRASPAAPPVPRRAAGRRRAATIVKSDGPAQNEKGEPVLEEAKEDAAAGQSEKDKDVKEEAPAPTPAPAPVPIVEETAATVAAAEETTLTSSSETKDEPAAASITADEPLRSSPSPEPMAVPTPAPAPPLPPRNHGQTLTVHNKQLTVDSSLLAPESPLFSAMVSPGFEPPPVPPKSDSSPSDGHSREGSDEKKAEWEQFVGDTTWEERTWKEIVRLREEMFWARIGSVR